MNTLWRMRSALPILGWVLSLALASAGGQTIQDPPVGRPDAVIDLASHEGVQLVKGEWRYHDVKIEDADSRSVGPDLKPSGAPIRTYDYAPHAGPAGFDDSQWEAIDATTLDQRRSTAKVCFNWYRINVTIPEKVGTSGRQAQPSLSLASMRKPMLSRYYIQCDLEARLEDWPDDRFWQEFRARCPKDMADSIVTGPSIEKSIAPLRSFVAEPMRYGHLFLAGDAAHIVPPTGAKGLNLAVSDVFYLSRALAETYRTGRTHYLDCYSDMALRRVWGAVRMSWWLTMLLHRFPAETAFEEQMRLNQFDYLYASEHAQASLAEQYAGLPFEE